MTLAITILGSVSPKPITSPISSSCPPNNNSSASAETRLILLKQIKLRAKNIINIIFLYFTIILFILEIIFFKFSNYKTQQL